MVVRCVDLCPQALNRLDLHFEGVGNGPVVISWISREHDLYSGASPISIVVTFRHDRRLLLLLGLYTTGQLVDGQQKERKPVFIKRKWNHVIFSRATILSFHPVLSVLRFGEIFSLLASSNYVVITSTSLLIICIPF